jgi:hypothetical protein
MWVSVQALFRCNVAGELDNILYEKKIFLINVSDLQKISEKADHIALSFEHQYKNSEGGEVSWQFVKITEIQELYEKELYDGVEVFSRLMWEDEALEANETDMAMQKKIKREQDD